MMSSGAPSPSSFSLSPPAAPDASAYTFRACHTYNRSWNGTASSARNDFLQHAYEVGIESTLATTYRIIFGALYFAIVFWGAHQFILHGRRRRRCPARRTDGCRHARPRAPGAAGWGGLSP